MAHDSIYMYSENAILLENKMTARGDVVIIQDSINIFSDSLEYLSNIKLAELYDNVVLESKDKKLFTNHLLYDAERKIGTFQDTAILTRETMKLSSLRGTFDVERKWARFKDQVVITDESFSLTCDSLDYDTEIDRAYFISPTYILREGKKIYCEDGYYDMIEGKGYFSDNAILSDGDQRATALDIQFSEDNSSVILKGNAIAQDSTSIATGEQISINDDTGDIYILDNGRYEMEDKVIVGDNIYYNKNTEYFKTIGRSTIFSKDGILTADTTEYISDIDEGRAVGNVILEDTTENRTIYSELLYYKDSTEYVKATVDSLKPMIVQLVEEDTLYIVADTLIRNKPSDSLSYLQAILDVKMYKSDLQAVCDSLYYSDQDSLFSLYKNPITWSDTTQFKGDTIDILLKNDKVSEIIATKKAFITSENVGQYYDQIKGRLVHSYLEDDELTRMDVKGNAESIFFFKDEDDAYIGPRMHLCSSMTFFFAEGDLDSINTHTEPESVFTPMEQATEADLKLSDFKWHSSLRPKGVVGLRKYNRRRATVAVADSVQIVGEEGIEEGLDDFEADVLDILNPDGKTQEDKTELELKTKEEKPVVPPDGKSNN